MRANSRQTSAIRKIVGLAITAGVIVLLAAGAQPPDAAYVQSFEKWKAELVQGRKEHWLPLAGLFWLKPGANIFGSANDNAVVLPSGPEHAGTFKLDGEEVSVDLRSNVDAKIDGQAQRTAKLYSDVAPRKGPDGKSLGPTIIELGSLRMHVIKRGARIGIRVKDVNSEAVGKYSGPVFYLLDLDYRVTGTFVPSDGKRTVDVPNILGDVESSPIAGEVRFKLNGQEMSLTSFEGDPAEGLSFVLSDPTSKTDTYPGGRFLDTDPVVDGKVVIDFNRAYSPPCSVTPYATCPLAPKENRLPVAILAGEKYDRKHGHH